MPDTTTNVALRDAMVRHQIQLQRFAKGVTKKIHDVLNKSEQDIAQMIRDRLAAAVGLDTVADVRRLQTVLSMLENLRTTTWDTLDATWNEQLIALATTEPGFLANQLDTTSPVVLDMAMPALAQLKSIVTSSPFEGQTLKDWSASLAADDIRRMEAQIRLGMVAGEDSATIARRIVGSAKLLGKDGATQITRDKAAAITRTAVNFIANQARRAFILDNQEIFQQEMFVATLDDRTTMLCASLDGDLFDVGKGPVPPLHWNCRSTRVPVLEGNVVGQRPFKASTEKQMLKDFAKQQGIKPVASRDSLPRGMKGKYDKFAQKAVRDQTGQVPANTSYQQWLSTQSAAFQDDVLGQTKGQLFRNGGLTLKKFVAVDGSELSLSDLATKQASAFRAAGLDPGNF
jgi:SPP1 gp7 family putative phage head morphogenesis protein